MIGLISDTHSLLRPEALQALSGSELIIHAGDVGDAIILDRLREIAQVIAIRGNIDKSPALLELPETAVVQVGSVTIYVLHDLHQLDFDPAARHIDIVISGHSHKPSQEHKDGVVYINPGSAGPRRFKLPTTVARLTLQPPPTTVEFITLL